MANWFKRAEKAPVESEVRAGSVDSAGGTSPLLGVQVPDRDSSLYVTVDEALSIPAVGRAVAIIATGIAQLDLEVFKQGSMIDSSLANRPDKNRPASSFLKRTAVNLATTGNAYWRLYRNSDGAVINMECLPPRQVSVFWDERGNKKYDYTDYHGKTITLPNNLPTNNSGKVEHIRLGEFEGYPLGRSPIQMHNRALRQIITLDDYYEKFLKESDRPTNFIWSFADDLDDAELAQSQDRITQTWNEQKPYVIRKGVSVTPFNPSPESAQLSSFKAQVAVEVSRMFGVPTPLLSAGIEGSSMTYQNMLTVAQQFILFGLEEYLTAIEDAFTNVLPNGQTAKFNTENWLRSQQAIVAGSAQASAAADVNLSKEAASGGNA